MREEHTRADHTTPTSHTTHLADHALTTKATTSGSPGPCTRTAVLVLVGGCALCSRAMYSRGVSSSRTRHLCGSLNQRGPEWAQVECPPCKSHEASITACTVDLSNATLGSSTRTNDKLCDQCTVVTLTRAGKFTSERTHLLLAYHPLCLLPFGPTQHRPTNLT